MQGFALIVIAIVVAPIVALIWLISKTLTTQALLDKLSNRIAGLEAEIRSLRQTGASPTTPTASQKQAEINTPGAPHQPPIDISTQQPEVLIQKIEPAPPIFQSPPRSEEKPVSPPKYEPQPEPVLAPTHGKAEAPAINWEQFMGVKGFAWLGGFALFLGIAFFIKYSFDNNLISPALRMGFAFLAGLGLIAGGRIMARKNPSTLAQTLCATGVVVLYAVTFGCWQFYHFSAFTPLTTFAVMAAITTGAFLLAVDMDAQVVAILGMLGGFLTPLMLSTGQDNPLGLFGYIAILDAGLLLIALRRRWDYLAMCAAVGTILMQLGWLAEFFDHYSAGNKFLIPLGVFASFNALWLLAHIYAQRREKNNPWLAISAFLLTVITLVTTGWFLDHPSLAIRVWLIFGFVFVIDLMAIFITRLNERFVNVEPCVGIGVFGLMTFWTTQSLTNDLLYPALTFYFIFGCLHSALPMLLARRNPEQSQTEFGFVFPILTLAIMLIPIFKFSVVSFAIWPAVLLVDLLAVGLAALSASLLPVLAVLGLTFIAIGALIFKIPDDLAGLVGGLALLGVFSLFFVGIGVWFTKRHTASDESKGFDLGNFISNPKDVAAFLPGCAVVLPFSLLIMATLRLQLLNPTPIFGLALLLIIVLLGISRWLLVDLFPLVGLACVTVLELAWHTCHSRPHDPAQPLAMLVAWYLGFFALFASFPFCFIKKFGDRSFVWAASALASLPAFFFVYESVKLTHPGYGYLGLLPAGFAIPEIVCLAIILRQIPASNRLRLGQLAWFGGTSLLFITLIFPIQFERQWITLGWALEGMALLWWFRRVPHPGLKVTAFVLLLVTFVRLALNPAVLDYHVRSAHPIFNWYLYTYGIAIICFFIASQLLDRESRRLYGRDLPPLFAAMGTILTFLLLNIEIADFFSPAGSTLTFQFEGNFARDMTYSIAWALFAFALLIFGIFKRAMAARLSAMALLCVTLLKLFLHDLAQLGQLYRIGAFIGVAVIAMLASFAYTKFFRLADDKTQLPKPE